MYMFVIRGASTYTGSLATLNTHAGQVSRVLPVCVTEGKRPLTRLQGKHCTAKMFS